MDIDTGRRTCCPPPRQETTTAVRPVAARGARGRGWVGTQLGVAGGGLRRGAGGRVCGGGWAAMGRVCRFTGGGTRGAVSLAAHSRQERARALLGLEGGADAHVVLAARFYAEGLSVRATE